jgi:hypothetical protein
MDTQRGAETRTRLALLGNRLRDLTVDGGDARDWTSGQSGGVD